MKYPTFISNYFGLSRSIYVLFTARIVNRMGDFVQFFLVLYLTSKLGFDEASAGRFIMITGVMNGVGVMLGGYLSDKINRKKILLASQLVLALAYAACGFLPVSMAVPWLIFSSSAFRGATWPVTNAMVTDLTEGEERKKAFSLLYLGTNIGVAVGPMIAGMLFTNHIRWMFWGDAATTLFAAMALLFYVPDTKPTHERINANRTEDAGGERAEDGFFLAVFLRRPVLVFYLMIAVLTSFVYSQHQFSLPLQINELFVENGPKIYGYLFAFNAAVVLAATAIVTHLTRRRTPIANITFANLLYLVGFGMIIFISRLPLFFLSTAIWTIGEIMVVTNSSVFVASHTPITHRGRFNGVVTLIHGFGFAVSPWISGMVIKSGGTSLIWPIVAATAAVATILYWILGRVDRLRNS